MHLWLVLPKIFIYFFKTLLMVSRTNGYVLANAYLIIRFSLFLLNFLLIFIDLTLRRADFDLSLSLSIVNFFLFQ